ncbi:MAG: FecR family protein, partial [Tannerellaceae bacterium]
MNTDKNSIKENDENAFVFNKTLQVFDALKGPATQEEAMLKKDKVFAAIQSRIEPQRKPVRYRDLYIALTSVAATLLVVIGGMSIMRSESPNVINLAESIAEQRVEVYSPAGMISKLTLPDGSKVTLNNNSTLSYPVKFSGNERKIELDGEAFFEIEKDSLKPFLINTEGMDVRVLGTSFNLKAYEDDVETILSLKEGVVQAETTRSGEKENIKLEPGEQLVVNRLSET